MNSNEIRTKFLEYFSSLDHKILPSASLIPHDDTLLFTAAGMVPLKEYFSGNKIPENYNMTSSQKCIRTIDIDIIGDTDRHLSFFEMLGNFSVGKYFKKEAIRYSYDYITNHLEIPKEKLWFTVYKNDDESYNIWKNDIGIPEERIQRGDKDNFWHMNIPGPCGPCSEIFIDRGEKYGSKGGPIGGGEDRYIEIWNLVFMESIQDKPFEVVGDLPSKNIDTGMGLERLAMVLQEKDSLFGIDTFSNMYKALNKVIANRDEKLEKIILDHVKASTFMISDGVVPTNEGRGYILRRLLRRAIRAINMVTDELISLNFLADIVVDNYKDSYPELLKNKEKINKLIISEESLFHNTLLKGTAEINNKLNSGDSFTTKDAFHLFETFGFPLELTEEIVVEHGFEVDKEEFNKLFQEHKKKSNKNKDSSKSTTIDTDNNNFVGYELLTKESEVYDVQNIDNDKVIFTVDTPFYYEAGGQVSDEGVLLNNGNEIPIKKLLQTSSGAVGYVVNDSSIQIGDEITQIVESKFRNAVSKSHTAAHIVHASLRNTLGDHVAQAGSHVAPGKFRFDFSHTNKVSQDELNIIFKDSNNSVFNDLEVNTNVMNIQKAKEEGALAFFGDKYGDDVRVVNIGNFSKELCGGTHVSNSHDVGLIVLTGESSIGSNLRRVEMLSGIDAYNFLTEAYRSYSNVSEMLKTTVEDVPKRLSTFLEDYEEYSSKIATYKQKELTVLTKNITSLTELKNKKNIYVGQVSLDSNNEVKDLALECISTQKIDIIVLVSEIGNKTSIVGATAKNIDIDISKIIGETSKLYGGGASKDPYLSIGGGPGKYSTDMAISFIEKALLDII
ncbi:alanine--tRNA ligase [Acidimicrobiia bacterium]|nr:alanine--tRNA ligase [Acidimicrobiia bacterium]